MAIRPNGINHLALSTRDIKVQIEFFTDVLGGALKALYWMHGVENTFHAFVELNPACYIAFVQHPENSDTYQLGITHAGTAGGAVAAGTMQHLAMNVDSLDDLLAMRDRIRSRGVPVIGPMNHGMCQSMYFAGPEGLSLEGIDAHDLDRFLKPDPYERPATAVSQPTMDPTKPHLAYPERTYAAMLVTPDEVFWNAVTSEPPVKV
jgi:catechol 2,3-dioxygenase-like lactoylglutathione lyase family enzyme